MNFDITARKIRKMNLNKYHYTLSLLQEGLRVGCLQERDIVNLKQQFLLLLKELILQYTLGESTSIKVETAEGIQSSLFYSIDAYASSLCDPNDAIKALLEKPLRKIHAEGLELLKIELEQTKALFNQVKSEKLDIPLEIYNDSIEKAIPQFFKKYELVFNAHNTMTMLDYPLAFDDMRVQGVSYIKNYLNHLQIENEFCRHFSLEAITNTLRNYGRLYDVDYTQAPINVFEVVLTNGIFSSLVHETAESLDITEMEYRLIEARLAKATSSELSSLITATTRKIVTDLHIDNPALNNYVLQFQQELAKRVVDAAPNGNLRTVLVLSPGNEIIDDSIILKPGNAMDDDLFRALVAQVLYSDTTEEKVKIIRSKIQSITDYIDLLEADCLYGDEYCRLFAQLSNMELAVLGKIVLWEESRADLLTTHQIRGKTPDIEWQHQFIRFLMALNEERANEILGQIKLIHLSDR